MVQNRVNLDVRTTIFNSSHDVIETTEIDELYTIFVTFSIDENISRNK